MQRKLIPSGDGLDEPDPVLLGYANLSLIEIEQIAEGFRLGFTLMLVRTHDVYTRDGKHAPVNWWPSRAAGLNETHSDPFNKRQNCPSGFVNWKINTDWDLISGINEDYQEFASEIRPLTLFKLMRSSRRVFSQYPMCPIMMADMQLPKKGFYEDRANG